MGNAGRRESNCRSPNLAERQFGSFVMESYGPNLISRMNSPSISLRKVVATMV